MINKKAKILKTKPRLYRQMCKKHQSFIELTGAEASVKPTLQMYVLQSLQWHFSGFHFEILFLKTLKLGKFL